MRALYYECFSGISGDMHIGAMVDLGVPTQYLQAELGKLSVAAEFDLVLERGKKLGISGTKASVNLAPDSERPHRHLRHIREIIESANYPVAVTQLALKIFGHIAEAEAKIHDIGIEQVHFHEVGATDSIVDIVAAALCFDYLAVDAVYCGEVEVGGGMVRCQHGLMPVPAPATAAILSGVPCHYGRVDSEATTPTGAAILRALVTDFCPPQNFTSQQQGYGVGQKDFAVPNILRVSLGEIESGVASKIAGKTKADLAAQDDLSYYQRESNVELECNIDDMPPEAFQPLLDGLFAVGNTGVLDAFVTPVIMKKQRPAHKLTVLLQAPALAEVLQCVFANATTLGVRTRQVEKWMLPRTEHSLPTSLGPVRVKVATTVTGEQRWKVEHDDVLALVQANDNAAYLDISQQVRAEVATQVAALKPKPPAGAGEPQ